MTSAPLTAASLAALDAAAAASSAEAASAEDEDFALRALLEQEASRARASTMLALQREFQQLSALSPKQAENWQQRRELSAVRGLQGAWRRTLARRAFADAVQRTQLHKRATAATKIQRVQRTRQPPPPQGGAADQPEEVATLQLGVIESSLAMARELRAARQAQAAWRSGTVDGAASAAEPPPLPDWLERPDWERELESQKPGGSSVVHALRDAALRGLRTDDPQSEILRQVHAWPQLRAAMQADAVRRQVGRTNVAALHAQLRFLPPLPPAPPPTASASADLDKLPPVLPSKPHVMAAHRRMLREQYPKAEVEESAAAADGSSEGGAPASAAAAAGRAAPGGGAARAPPESERPAALLTPRAGESASAAATRAALSTAADDELNPHCRARAPPWSASCVRAAERPACRPTSRSRRRSSSGLRACRPPAERGAARPGVVEHDINQRGNATARGDRDTVPRTAPVHLTHRWRCVGQGRQTNQPLGTVAVCAS